MCGGQTLKIPITPKLSGLVVASLAITNYFALGVPSSFLFTTGRFAPFANSQAVKYTNCALFANIGKSILLT